MKSPNNVQGPLGAACLACVAATVYLAFEVFTGWLMSPSPTLSPPLAAAQNPLARRVGNRALLPDPPREATPKESDPIRALVIRAIERSHRADALAELERARPELRRGVTALVVDPDATGIGKAAIELSELQGRARPAVPAIVAAFKRLAREDATGGGLMGDYRMRANPLAMLACLQAIVIIDPEDRSLREIAIAATEYNNVSEEAAQLREQGYSVVSSLATKKPKEADELIEALVKQTSTPFRAPAAIAAIGNMGQVASKVLPRLRELRLEPDTRIRDAAEEAIKKIEG